MNDLVKFSFEFKGAIKSLTEYIETIRNARKDLGEERLWYRGQSNTKKYKLLPSIGRPHFYNEKKYKFSDYSFDQEERILERFSRRAYSHLNRSLNPWEAIFLARHYNLPTRILDWTASPLIALYFACVDNPGIDGEIWAIRHNPKSIEIREYNLAIDMPDKFSHPCKLFSDKTCQCSHSTPDTYDAIKIVYPLYNSPRIVAQDGVFTLHTKPDKALNEYANQTFCPERLDIDFLLKWEVEQTSKPEIIKELDWLGINKRIIFPDLDGLAMGLTETLVLWQGKDEVKS